VFGKVTDKLAIYQSASSIQKVLTCAFSELIPGVSTIHIFDCPIADFGTPQAI
jgi:hypothetical protein